MVAPSCDRRLIERVTLIRAPVPLATGMAAREPGPSSFWGPSVPTPRKGETRADWMRRCVPVLRREGRGQDQAVAICMDLYKRGGSVSKGEFETGAEVLKVDEQLGLVLGYAIVCTDNGEPYFDKQGDHIPEDAMLEAATDFMLHSRAAGDMHTRKSGEVAEAGQVVFAWPMTSDIAKAFGLEPSRTGLMIAMKPDSAELLQKFRDGVYTGFSIGGKRITEEAA